MYTFCIILIFIASILLILAVLAQHPKSGMAANFGATSQVMGVRQASDFLEKFTWGTAIAIVVLSLVATMSISKGDITQSKSVIEQNMSVPMPGEQAFPIPQGGNDAATEAPAAETPTTPAENGAE